MVKQYFDILGIAPTKDEKLVKKAYRKKAMLFHPDKNPSEEANKQFILINDAYEIIIRLLEQSKTNSEEPSNLNIKPKKGKTKEELFQERLRQAKLRYEYLKRKEEEENEKYYQLISAGKSWKRFKIVMVGCLLLAVLFILDNIVLPTRWEEDSVTHGNRTLAYSGVSYNRIVPIATKNGHKLWVRTSVLGVIENKNKVYIERTFFFRDVKYIWIWDRSEWIKSKADFSVTGSFPLVPLFLLIPFVTYCIKDRTLTYSLLFNVSLYLFGITLVLLLYFNDRWAHILTLGFL